MSTETRTVSATGGEKGVKAERYDLIPREATDSLARVYAFGATKYADHNWRKGYEWSKSYAAAMRHLTAFWSGETYDSESGLPHLAHAMFHLAALSTWLEQDGEGGQFDDRYRPAETAAEEEERLRQEQVDFDGVADEILSQRLFRPGPTQVDGRIDRTGEEELTLTAKGWEERLGVKLSATRLESRLMTRDEFWELAETTGADHTKSWYDEFNEVFGPDLLSKRAPSEIRPVFNLEPPAPAPTLADAVKRAMENYNTSYGPRPRF